MSFSSRKQSFIFTLHFQPEFSSLRLSPDNQQHEEIERRDRWWWCFHENKVCRVTVTRLHTSLAQKPAREKIWDKEVWRPNTEPPSSFSPHHLHLEDDDDDDDCKAIIAARHAILWGRLHLISLLYNQRQREKPFDCERQRRKKKKEIPSLGALAGFIHLPLSGLGTCLPLLSP